MRARPFRRLAVGAPLDPRLERGGAAERGEDTGSAARVIAGGNHVARPQRVRLILLLAREAEHRQLCALLAELRDRAADPAAEKTAEESAENPLDRIAPRRRLPLPVMIAGDVAGLMAECERE